MDSGSHCSAVRQSVEDNKLSSNPELKFSESPNLLVVLDDDPDKVEANGSGDSNEIHDTASSGPPATAHADAFHQSSDAKEGVETEHLGTSVTSSPSAAVSPPAFGFPSSTKGKGLRKWRRFKRDVAKDATVNADDGNKILKRVFSGSGNQSAKPNNSGKPVEIKQNGGVSAGSTNMLKDTAFSDGDVKHQWSLDSRFGNGSPFTPGIDSENSEERSSKFSTAASAPRVTSDRPAVLGHVRERNKIKNFSGKWLGTSPGIQHVKGSVESSKKPRGERVQIETQNSHSSMESDSRSSNFVFVQGAYSATSNGKLGGRSLNYDRENSVKAHAGEQQFDVEVQTGSVQENGGEIEDISHGDLAADVPWEDKEEKSVNHRNLLDKDPLVESILSLQSAQEALESEVERLGNIGKFDSVPAALTFAGPRIYESSPSDQFEYPRNLSSLESQVLNLTENVAYLESRLEEARTLLEMKESRVAELEATLNSGDLTKGTLGNTTDLELEKCRDVESEFEGFFKQKIEGEVTHMVLKSTIEKLRVAAGDQITLLREQVALAGEQAQLVNKLGEAESKAEILKKHAELEKYTEEILGTEDVLRMPGRVCKVGSCFFIQLMLLILVFWLLVLQLSPRSGVVVPT